jgi:peptide/nickel transport system permease protein
MIYYLIRRLIYTIIILFIVSIVSFALIQLPPGDYLTSYIVQLEESGQKLDEARIESLRRHYGLDLPMYMQYFKWMGDMMRGDFGDSFAFQKPVIDIVAERILLSITISLVTLLFTYLMAIPIGIFSATHQYSAPDYIFMVIGFIGLATPNFLLALILIYLFNKYFGISVGGLFSVKYAMAPWSFAKVIDLLKHLPVPIIVVGTAGTAGLIRVMRGCLLDELRKQYVVTARAKGLREGRLLFKYPVRVAINPVVSTIGWILPSIVSGATLTSVVLSLPTVGPVLLRALLSQDMFLAGSIIMFLTALTVIGTILSDILLVIVDPRIRYEKGVGR